MTWFDLYSAWCLLGYAWAFVIGRKLGVVGKTLAKYVRARNDAT